MEYRVSRFGEIPYDCDVPDWIPFLTATDLGVPSKLTVDFTTGEVFMTYLDPPDEMAVADEGAAK